jgi:hypothetical protein
MYNGFNFDVTLIHNIYIYIYIFNELMLYKIKICYTL